MLTLFSPAKINLFLRILGKRSDGYHALSSVFQTISLCDTLTFERSEKDRLTCTDPDLPLDQTNLIMKALSLFRKKTGATQNYHIRLIKNIPTQAGLGGGSSNAATTLWGCNHLASLTQSTSYTNEALQQWGEEIGSDVPFFFSMGTAYCSGRGEKVRNLPSFAQRSLTIIKPSIGLSTVKVYEQLASSQTFTDTKRENKTENEKELAAFLEGSLPCFNDLEKPAFELCPRLFDLKKQLIMRGFETVLMSGSGSSFFCFGKGKNSEEKGIQLFETSFINRSLSNWYH